MTGPRMINSVHIGKPLTEEEFLAMREKKGLPTRVVRKVDVKSEPIEPDGHKSTTDDK